MSRQLREHQRQARLMELETRFVVSAVYNASGGKGAASAARKAARAVKFLPEKAKKPRQHKPIPYELARATFGDPLIPIQE